MRFQVGELARIVVEAEFPEVVGKTVEILEAGEIRTDSGRVFDYETSCPDGQTLNEDELWVAMDWQLQKINPPDEPISLTRSEEVEA
jgi:hypothetical protein